MVSFRKVAAVMASLHRTRTLTEMGTRCCGTIAGRIYCSSPAGQHMLSAKDLRDEFRASSVVSGSSRAGALMLYHWPSYQRPTQTQRMLLVPSD